MERASHAWKWGYYEELEDIILRSGSSYVLNRLRKYLPKLIQPAQYGFIEGRNILHNLLNVQMTTHYV
mgnify:FL=1